MKKKFLFLLFVLSTCTGTVVQAQRIEELRGGWIADIDGTRHIYYIVLRNDTVSGIYCFDCDNPDNLAFIDDGALDDTGLRFSLYHYPEGTRPYQEKVEAQLVDHELHLDITDPEGEEREVVFVRTPDEERITFPIADFRTNQPTGGTQERTLPGPAQTVTAGTVIGKWLWGTGPTKQVFIFREHKGGIRGMVCGPCDSAPDFAPLEQITLNGTHFHFEIVHEDNGGGFEQYGPFSNVTDAQISEHEMHMSTYASYAGEDGRRIEMTLLGPVVSRESFRSE